MKKLFIIPLFSIISMGAMAQDAEESAPTEKYSVSTNSFASNWFVTLQGSYSNFIDGGADNSLLSTPTWGASIALGKWFTPGLGLRAKLNGWEAKNSNFTESSDRHNKYIVLTGDAMFNLTNLFKGYNEERIWNLIPYFSGGLARNCTHSHYTPVFGAGVISTWKITSTLNVNLECSYKATASDFGGISNNQKSDRFFAIEAGITYKLGKNSWRKAPDINTINTMTQMEIDALNAQIADLEAENERLRNSQNK